MIKEIKNEKVSFQMEVDTEFEEHRFQTFFKKEPETISWIEEIFLEGDTFYDIGANIGVYSLYASAYHQGKVKVLSFEPVYHNFAKLCRNININKFSGSCICYPVAINKETKFEKIKLASNISGSAMHVMPGSIDHHNKKFEPIFEHGVFSISLDDMIYKFKLEQPNHIKVDTDGSEESILSGAGKAIMDKNLKSVLIEVDNVKSKDRVRDIMERAGFNLDHPINSQKNHSRKRRQEGGQEYENLIFTR